MLLLIIRSKLKQINNLLFRVLYSITFATSDRLSTFNLVGWGVDGAEGVALVTLEDAAEDPPLTPLSPPEPVPPVLFVWEATAESRVAQGGKMAMIVSRCAVRAVFAASNSVQMVRCIPRACAIRHEELPLPPPPHRTVLFWGKVRAIKSP